MEHSPPDLCRPAQLGRALRRPTHIYVLLLSVSLCVWMRRLTCAERLLEIGNDVVNVLGADGNPDQILCDTTVDLLLLTELFVCGGPRVDGERFGITDARQRS